MSWRRWLLVGVAFIVVSTAVSLLAIFLSRSGETETLVGWAVPNGSATIVVLHDTPNPEGDPLDGPSYLVSGAHWTGTDGVQHDPDDRPHCIGEKLDGLTHVELVVAVEDDLGPRLRRVTRFRCLD